MSPIRDRLYEMRQIQNNGNSSINTTGKAEDEPGTIEKTFQKTTIIRENIEIIKNNTARASDILKNNVFKISKNYQDELDSLFRSNTSAAYKINSNLKEFENELHTISDETSAEFRIKKVQYNSLQQEFRDALKESSDCLEFHRNNRKQLLKKSLQTARGNVDDEELEALLDENKLDVFTDNHLTTTEEARQQLADIEERHKELLKIEKHLNEVLDLFIKLATLVEQQQESVNRVEYHAETATDYIEHGTKDLQKTKKSRNKFRKRKIYIILIVTVVILLAVLIMYFV